MVVVGAGVIGIEYASMFAALGTRVTVVEKRDNMLDFCDPEIVEALKFHLRDLAVTFRFGEEVTAVDVGAAGTVTTLASGKQIPAETVMYSAGRQGLTERPRPAQRRPRDRQPRTDRRRRASSGTKVDHIYAVGDVIGFPRLAANVDGPGPARRLPRVRRTGQGHDRICSPSASTPFPRCPTCGATEVELTKKCVASTRSGSRATASWRAARSPATPTACSNCWCSTDDLEAASACTSSAPAPPRWSTSARP